MDRPGYGQIGRFYLPLAASGLLMTLQQPVVTAGITRTPNPETALAAYGIALNIAVLLESPVQMLLPTANAVVRDQPSYRLLHRFTISIGLALSGLLFLVASSPLGSLTVSRLIGAPSAVARQVLPALLVMALWPLVVGWRRFHQGLLIRRGHTRAVGYATACRLLTITAVVTLAISRYDWPGAFVGCLALMAGAIVEAAVVTARSSRPEARPEGLLVLKVGFQSQDETQPVVNSAALARFYFPLAATSVLTIVTWPLIAAGISRMAEPASSLAAWPVALSILWLLTTPIQMLQQLAIAQIGDHRGSARAVTSFGLMVGLSATALMGVFAFSPLIQFFLRKVILTPPDVTPLVVWTVRILTPLPVIVAGQSLLQGLLIAWGATVDVRLAMTVNLAALGLLLVAGIVYGRLPGAILGAGAMSGGLMAETAVLWWRAKSQT